MDWILQSVILFNSTDLVGPRWGMMPKGADVPHDGEDDDDVMIYQI